jgi:hypothetical protein
MTTPAPSVRIEPAIHAWSLADASSHGHAGLAEVINARAKRLGTATLDTPVGRLIVTGHQAQLWHPGILAKDIAMAVASERFSVQRLHVVVDQDTNEAWRLDVPDVVDDELRVRSVLLADQKPGVPTGFQPPADPKQIQEQLAGLDAALTGRLSEAFIGLPDCASLAEQVAVVLARLKKPYAGGVPVMMVSDLALLPAFNTIVSRMLNEARQCAMAYNHAVAKLPGAGMTPLVVTRDLVELPLWAVGWNEPRRRVFVDLADSEPLFIYDDGEPIDRSAVSLLPRALLLTAVMRSALCDLFIHGTGGLVYDRVTEAWWHGWTGETLAPMARVTADLFLDLGVPVADRADLDRAVWRRHHLPHNLDRALNLDSQAVREKHDLLAHMSDDRGRARRRKAFSRIHQINRELAGQHPEALASAERDLRLAHIGVKNARVARRRDWCFALYPPKSLHALCRLIAGQEVQCPT